MNFTNEYMCGQYIYVKEVGQNEMYGFISKVYNDNFDLEIIVPLHHKGYFVNIRVDQIENLVILAQ